MRTARRWLRFRTSGNEKGREERERNRFFHTGFAMGDVTQFVIHSVASDKEYLQRICAANPFPDKNTNARACFSNQKRKWSGDEEVILVIDDDRASRRMLLRALGEAGYACRESASGVEALEMLHAEIAVAAPARFRYAGTERRGSAFAACASDPNPAIAQLPAIMLTGHGGEESEVLCLEAGANDFVTKPINLAVLRARIETQLRLQSLRQQLQQQNDELEAWREESGARPGGGATDPAIADSAEAAAFARLGSGRGLSAGHSGRRRHLWLAADGGSAARSSGSRMRPVMARRRPCSPPWRNCFSITAAPSTRSPAEIMEAVNNDFRSIFGARSFMTAMCVALDPARRAARVSWVRDIRR